MTEQKNFIRPNLKATKDGVVEPKIEVELWLDELEDLVRKYESCPACSSIGGSCGQVTGHFACGQFDGRGGALADLPDDQTAYDLIALVGKLERTRPELIAEAGNNGEFAHAKAILTERGADFARRALSLLNPVAWLKEVEDLESWLDELPGDEAEIQRLIGLLTDLDDAEVMIAVAERFGVRDDAITVAVENCAGFIYEEAILFVGAGVWIQAMGATMRSDLDQTNYGLAATALKFLRLLDELENAQDELTLANVVPLPTEVVRRLYEECLKDKVAGRVSANE